MSAVPVGRWPVAPDARLALIFGGTFDPPHVAHVELPCHVRDSVGADVVVYVPAAQSPHKKDGPEAGGADRVEMLRLALEGRRGVAISTIELDRAADGEPSYTIDTLREIRSTAAPSLALRLLIGADQAASFHRWREPDEIARIAEPLVMLRPPHESAAALLERLRESWGPAEAEAWRRRIVASPVRKVEATEVRRLLETDRDDPRLADLVPGAVLAYIRSRGLYT